MPFNRAIAGIGGRSFIFRIDADRTTSFVVEDEVQSINSGQGTLPGDKVAIILASGVSLTGSIGIGAAIDGLGMNAQAFLNIVMTSSFIRGRGGRGGDGGDAGLVIGFLTQMEDGAAGSTGRHAIRLGCPTTISGTGDVIRGYGGGGGGGGGADTNFHVEPGSGGGGGAALGAGGSAGSILFGIPAPVLGEDGDDGTLTNGGNGGDTVGPADGGDGGGPGAAEAGVSPPESSGGAAGADGDAINTQGGAFTVNVGAGITVTGPIN